VSDEAGWDGLLPIDKPAGPTSHDLVARVRAATGSRRVGHTGTLDPSATGLLLLVLGRATRLARFVPDAPKTYRGILTLGVTTTTDDLAGDVVRRHDGPLPEAALVLAAAASHLGKRSQVPPSYSARQVGGTRMYRLARRGIAVDAPATDIVVERLDLTATQSPELWTYEMVVSAGTYVRAIVRDLGAVLGCGAAVASLRRTAIGPVRVDDALSLPSDREALRQAVRSHLVPIDAMPLDLPSIALASADEAMRFAAGGVIAVAATDKTEPALAAVRDDGGRLLGVGQRGPSTLKPRMVLPRGA
jgi:tRNA pseudouridine55 synthase